MSNDFDGLITSIRDFATARNWEQFHTPKNLAMAITGEAGELASEFQWLKAEECLRTALSQEKLEAIAMEIADVQIYLLLLADVLEINVPDSVRKKIKINESRF